mgnify:CR=1 FL=1
MKQTSYKNLINNEIFKVNELGQFSLMRAKNAEKTQAIIAEFTRIYEQNKDSFRVDNIEAALSLYVNKRDALEDTALILARDAAQSKVLLDFGASVNDANRFGDTALIKAHSAEQSAVLLAAGADVNHQNQYGETALMHAKSVEQVKVLLQHHANVRLLTNSGKMAGDLFKEALNWTKDQDKRAMLKQMIALLQNAQKMQSIASQRVELPNHGLRQGNGRSG